MALVPLSRERRVDWACVLAGLLASGMSRSQIAEKLDVGISTLKDYMNEDAPSEPAHWAGQALLLLWCERCGRRLEEAPTKRVALSVSYMLRELNGKGRQRGQPRTG